VETLRYTWEAIPESQKWIGNPIEGSKGAAFSRLAIVRLRRTTEYARSSHSCWQQKTLLEEVGKSEHIFAIPGGGRVRLEIG
jgi:hypothetical protein